MATRLSRAPLLNWLLLYVRLALPADKCFGVYRLTFCPASLFVDKLHLDEKSRMGHVHCLTDLPRAVTTLYPDISLCVNKPKRKLQVPGLFQAVQLLEVLRPLICGVVWFVGHSIGVTFKTLFHFFVAFL